MVWCKFTLTVMFVQNSYGTGVPVAYLLHKFEHKVIIRTWLNHIAVYASNSPRHAAWPEPLPASFRPLHALAATAPTPPPASPAAAKDALVWNGVAAGWRSPPGTGLAATAAHVRRSIVAASPNIVPEGPAIPFCPAYIGMDCCGKETAAAEECLWASGYQGYGLSVAEFEAWVVWCSWHLDCAWARHLEEPGVCCDFKLRSKIRQMLADFRNNAVAVRGPGFAKRAAHRAHARRL